MPRRQPAEVLQQAAVVLLCAKSDSEPWVTVHLTVDQWQLQSQLARCPLAHVDLPEWKLLDSELADLWVCHFPSTRQVIVPHERLLQQLLQGVEPRDCELEREATELQDAHQEELLREVLLPELLELTVDEPVWCDHLEVDARLLLLACRSHQLREWLVQDCLRWDERELVQSLAEVARQRARTLPRWCRRQQLLAQMSKDVVREKQALLLQAAWVKFVSELSPQRQLVSCHVQQLQPPALRRWQVDLVARVQAALLALEPVLVATAAQRPALLPQLLEVRELPCTKCSGPQPALPDCLPKLKPKF